MRYLAVALVALSLISCSRDPNYLKQKYLESGNKYYDAGRYKEASIMYRRSLEKDRKFGEAYYKLALTDLKLQSVASAVPALRRAVSELKPGTPSYDDATLKLSEIMIVAAQTQENPEPLMKEVQAMTDALLKRSPNGWEGHKLTGDLHMVSAARKFRAGDGLAGKKEIQDAVSEYRNSLTAKPGDYIVTLALGRSLMLNGEISEAEGLFKSLIEKDKLNVNGYTELYRVYIAERRVDDAEGVLKKAMASHPSDASFRLALAQFYFVSNKRPELVKLLNDMKADLKKYPNAFIQTGDFYQRVGQYDEAVKQYEEGIQKDSGKKAVYLNHEVEAYVRMGKTDVAMSKNEEILRLDPKNTDARQLKATALLDKGGDAGIAMTELQSVVTAKPSNFVAHFNLGRAHFVRSEYEQARQEFDKAVELMPSYLPARFAQTQVAFLRGDNDGALRNADAILKISPNSVQARVMKAAALQRMQKYDDARGLLTEVLTKNPAQVETLLELGVLDLNERKNKEAIDLFHRAWMAQPTNIRGLLGESKAYLRDGQVDKSIQLIQVETQKQPNRVDLLRELGNAQMAAGHADDAIRTYQQVLGKLKEPRDEADVLSRLAQAYNARGDIQHSIESLEKAKDRVPNNPGLLTNLGMLYDEVSKRDQARKYYEMAIKVQPNSALALNNLAYLIAETNGGDLNLAQAYAERAKVALPNFSEVSDTLGWILLKKNLTDGALDNFRGLVVKVPQNPIYHYHYAMALKQKGDIETARKECQAALANKPKKSQEDSIRQLLSTLG